VRVLIGGLLIIWLLGAALLVSLLIPGCAAREPALVVPAPCEPEDVENSKYLVANAEGAKQ
jgi:hypothetical protein